MKSREEICRLISEFASSSGQIEDSKLRIVFGYPILIVPDDLYADALGWYCENKSKWSGASSERISNELKGLLFMGWRLVPMSDAYQICFDAFKVKSGGPPKIDGLDGPYDIRMEEWREYKICGVTELYRIDEPQYLWAGDTHHRVLDKDQVVHCVPKEDTIVRWRIKPGSPAVTF